MYGGRLMQRELLKLDKRTTLHSGVAPDERKENIIVTIPKSASNQMTNFKGISLMSIAAETQPHSAEQDTATAKLLTASILSWVPQRPRMHRADTHTKKCNRGFSEETTTPCRNFRGLI